MFERQGPGNDFAAGVVFALLLAVPSFGVLNLRLDLAFFFEQGLKPGVTHSHILRAVRVSIKSVSESGPQFSNPCNNGNIESRSAHLYIEQVQCVRQGKPPHP